MSSLRYLNKYLFRYRWRLLVGGLFVIISNLFGILPAKIIRESFDLVNTGIQQHQAAGNPINSEALLKLAGHTLPLLGGGIILAAVMRGIFLFFMRQTIIVVSRLIEYDLKNDIYSHYQVLPLSFYRRNNTGDLMNRITEDVSRVRMYVGPAIMYTLNTGVLFILVIISMISINTKLTFFALLPLPVMALVIYYVNSIIHRRSEEIQQQLSGLATFSQETFAGIRVLKSYVREEQAREAFEAQSEEYKRRSLNLTKVQSFFYPTVLLLAGLSIILTMYVGGVEVKNGNITAGNIAEFIVYINLLTFPMMSLGWVTSLVQRGAASQKRINEFMQTESEITTDKNETGPGIKGDITFKNVDFIYPDTGIKALKDISFKAEAGQFIAFIGRTGSGKSTIINLIARMYDRNSGQILIDGKDIKDYNPTYLRSGMSFVPQEVFLYSDTIGKNIAFGTDEKEGDLSREKIQQAAKNAVVYDNIKAFPEGFETMVGERGITLSGGQKQRVSIARAFIKEAQILLLDDSLSAVDTKTEESILRNLKKVMHNKTCIIISHRVSSIKTADMIYVMDAGSIIESGRHEDLLRQKGEYFKLYEKQLMEEEKLL